MEKPEEERSLLLKCLPPVGNISKWSGTKTSRTGPLQNVPKADFFQSSLVASKLLPYLEQQSRCQNTECRQLAQPPAWLRSCAVYTVSQFSPRSHRCYLLVSPRELPNTPLPAQANTHKLIFSVLFGLI